MTFNCNFKFKHNFKSINTISEKLPKVMQEITEDILNNIKGYAIKLENGHNSNGILVEMIDMSNKEVKGRVYADPSKFVTENGQSYLWFEYFGTGEYAEQEHIGKTQHFIESGYTEWLIPTNKVGRKLNYPIITIKGQQFYVAYGAKANHFMTDAEFISREENKDIIKKKIDSMIEECSK